MQIEVTIKGISPLLINRFTEAAEQSVDRGSSSAIGSGDKGTPREQAEPKLYKDNDGNLHVPGQNINAAIINAGRFHKSGRSQLTTGKTSIIPAGILVTDIICPLGTKEWEVDSRRTVNRATGGAHLTHRPRLDEWQLTFNLEVDEKMFNPKLVRELVDDAGKKIGICDFRPERKGPFGRFVVVDWKEIKESKAAA